MPSKRNKRHQAATDAVTVDHPPKNAVRNDYPHNLLCSICLEPPMKTMTPDDCGHLFCEECADNLFHSHGDSAVPCPMCRMPFTRGSIRHNLFVQRQVDALSIECPSDGCDWYRERTELPNHLRTCPEAIVACPHSTNGCSTKAKRKDILTHAANCDDAIIPCVHAADGCEEKMKRRDAPAHLGTCSHVSIQCPNDGCNAQTKRKESSKHQEECPHAVVSCPFSTHGCDQKVRRKDVEDHLKEQEVAHLKLKVGTLENSLVTLQKEHDSLKKMSVAKVGCSQRQIVKISLSVNKTTSDKFELFGTMWYLSTDLVDEDYRSLYLHLDDRQEFQAAFSFKLFTANNGASKKPSCSDLTEFGPCWGYDQFVSKCEAPNYTTADSAWYVEVFMKFPPNFKKEDM